MEKVVLEKMKAIREIFSGTGGNLSSKRTMVFLSFLVMCVIGWANVFLSKEVSQFVFEGFMWVVLGGLFSVASEQFSQKFGNKIETQKPTE